MCSGQLIKETSNLALLFATFSLLLGISVSVQRRNPNQNTLHIGLLVFQISVQEEILDKSIKLFIPLCCGTKPNGIFSCHCTVCDIMVKGQRPDWNELWFYGCFPHPDLKNLSTGASHSHLKGIESDKPSHYTHPSSASPSQENAHSVQPHTHLGRQICVWLQRWHQGIKDVTWEAMHCVFLQVPGTPGLLFWRLISCAFSLGQISAKIFRPWIDSVCTAPEEMCCLFAVRHVGASNPGKTQSCTHFTHALYVRGPAPIFHNRHTA